jgi:ribosomal protein S19
MVGKTYSVYNGVGFVPITPNSENIGKRLIDLAMRV